MSNETVHKIIKRVDLVFDDPNLIGMETMSFASKNQWLQVYRFLQNFESSEEAREYFKRKIEENAELKAKQD